jgi:hypothetical protein
MNARRPKVGDRVVFAEREGTLSELTERTALLELLGSSTRVWVARGEFTAAAWDGERWVDFESERERRGRRA